MSAYDHYVEWKKWDDHLFTLSSGASAYYDREVLPIAPPKANILEIGFGAGEFLVWARDRGFDIQGTEIVQELVERGRSLGFAVVNDSGFELEHWINCFDLICCFDVFEHLSSEEILEKLKFAARSLKPNGLLLLRFPNARSPFGNIYQNDDLTHRSRLSDNIIRHMLLSERIPLELIIAKEPAMIRSSNIFRMTGKNFARLVSRLMMKIMRVGYMDNNPLTLSANLIVILRKK